MMGCANLEIRKKQATDDHSLCTILQFGSIRHGAQTLEHSR